MQAFCQQERLLWTIGEGKVVAEPGQQRKRARLFQIRSDFLQKSAALFLESAAFFQKSAALFLAGRPTLGKYRRSYLMPWHRALDICIE